MKIGVISDIHADIKSLKIALDILAGKKVDTIVCAGDLVERGADGDAVVETIKARNIPCVMGNHDYDTPGNERWRRENLIPERYEATRLSEETIAFLETLPDTQRFEWEGKRILLAHGSSRSNVEYIYPFSQRELLERVIEEAEADIVILGHTHRPMKVCLNDNWILNPGAVMGRGTCGILVLPDVDFTIYSLFDGSEESIPETS